MKAIIVFSGGVDSTVVLSMAIDRGLECHAISFDYGQRHRVELKAAAAIAKFYGINQQVIKIETPALAGSSLISKLAVPKDRSMSAIAAGGIPNTYVPGRNTLFLAYAMGFAESLNAQEIHVGYNALDRIPYPDCRIEYLNAMQEVINLATRQAVEGNAPKIIAPLLHMDKKEIFQEGRRLNVPLDMTFSCYDPTPEEKPCGHCDACMLRAAANGVI
jgi:7-cyano-7-deazaguanine synthase